MPDLLKRDYGDPLAILLQRESESCKGCAFEFKAEGFGVTMWVCLKLDRAGRRHKHGARCVDFLER